MIVERGRTRHFAAAATRICAPLCLGIFLLAAVAEGSFAASLRQIEDFGANPGRLNMHVYVPQSVEPNPALVVALHGCAQQASDFDDETGLTALADSHGFVLLFPEQRQSNNQTQCFNWFSAGDNERGKGESASIRQMIAHMRQDHGIDPARVFALGLSAGGSMTAVLLANYPELFRAGAIIAGTPYGCNAPTAITWAWWQWLRTFSGEAFAASFVCGLLGNVSQQRGAEEWGDFVRDAAGTTPERWPALSLWQGGRDRVVDPANQSELVKQWTNVHGIDRTPDSTRDVNGIRHQVYRDQAGKVRLETYDIDGFAHAVPIDPGPGPEQCGIVADFTQKAGICSTGKILKFWGLAGSS